MRDFAAGEADGKPYYAVVKVHDYNYYVSWLMILSSSGEVVYNEEFPMRTGAIESGWELGRAENEFYVGVGTSLWRYRLAPAN